MSEAKNVFGEPLALCCSDPITGFYRSGCCETGPEDLGLRAVCAQVTAEFLDFSRARGNDLTTPLPAAGFPGLKPGDRWCLCAARWKEALERFQLSRNQPAPPPGHPRDRTLWVAGRGRGLAPIQ